MNSFALKLDVLCVKFRLIHVLQCPRYRTLSGGNTVASHGDDESQSTCGSIRLRNRSSWLLSQADVSIITTTIVTTSNESGCCVFQMFLTLECYTFLCCGVCLCVFRMILRINTEYIQGCSRGRTAPSAFLEPRSTLFFGGGAYFKYCHLKHRQWQIISKMEIIFVIVFIKRDNLTPIMERLSENI
jgi:hypothetical protein